MRCLSWLAWDVLGLLPLRYSGLSMLNQYGVDVKREWSAGYVAGYVEVRTLRRLMPGERRYLDVRFERALPDIYPGTLCEVFGREDRSEPALQSADLVFHSVSEPWEE